MAENTNREGLGNQPKSAWPTFTARDMAERPIDRLKPESELHTKVLKYLVERLEMSERAMSKFYPRWRINEMKLQAYIDLPDYEKQLKETTDKGEAPKVVSVVVPYSFSTISTIVTYLIHTFAGRKPMFQVGSNKKETAMAAQMMEMVLQYQGDHTRLIKHLFQFLQDGETYGLGVLRTQWKKETALRTVWRQSPGFLGIGSSSQKVREQRTVYEGNEVCSIDPFMFFPDPRVPIQLVNTKGEFVFWRSFDGKHMLLREESAGRLKWVNAAKLLQRSASTTSGVGDNNSNRHLASGGDPVAGMTDDAAKGNKNVYQVDQGCVEIIPAELGLGASEKVEKWIFTILNKNQIVQAEQMDADHGKHPVVVSEPYTNGYGFGNMGMSDYLGPMQDTVSWFINSHIHNVRTAMNNMFVVDPSMVEIKDLKEPGDGKLIRLKRAAYGQDVRAAIQQLPVQDVTRGHVTDLQLFMKMGDMLSSVTDNIRGLQDSGGRKTATEVRTSGEAAASRLAAHARLVSAQSLTDLTEQQVLNTQQNLSDEFYITIVGQQGLDTPIRVSPEMLVGDFTYPIHDGTLPLDRVAMLDVWKEIFLAVAQDQELRSQYNVPKIFEFVAELGGARNIDQFKMSAASPEMIAQQTQAGNMVPVGEAPNLPGLGPGARLAGATNV